MSNWVAVWGRLDLFGASVLLAFLVAAVPAHAHGADHGLMPDTTLSPGPAITIHRSANCGCCEQWSAHLADAGFRIEDHVTEAIHEVKQEQGITAEQASCHTAVVEGYVIEGHVPASSVQKLLTERPSIRGLAVPGMPMGSPGMEIEGGKADHYNVIAIAHDGTTSVFERH